MKIAILVCASIALRGLALSYLWAWFAVPLGAPPVGIANVLGLHTLASLGTLHGIPKKDDEDAALKMTQGCILSVLSLAFGFVYALAGGTL